MAHIRLQDDAGQNTRWRFVLVAACARTPGPGTIVLEFGRQRVL